MTATERLGYLVRLRKIRSNYQHWISFSCADVQSLSSFAVMDVKWRLYTPLERSMMSLDRVDKINSARRIWNFRWRWAPPFCDMSMVLRWATSGSSLVYVSCAEDASKTKLRHHSLRGFDFLNFVSKGAHYFKPSICHGPQSPYYAETVP